MSQDQTGWWAEFCAVLTSIDALTHVCPEPAEPEREPEIIPDSVVARLRSMRPDLFGGSAS